MGDHRQSRLNPGNQSVRFVSKNGGWSAGMFQEYSSVPSTHDRQLQITWEAQLCSRLVVVWVQVIADRMLGAVFRRWTFSLEMVTWSSTTVTYSGVRQKYNGCSPDGLPVKRSSPR